MSLWSECPEAVWTHQPSPPPALINHYGAEPHLSSWSETSNERRDHNSAQPQKYFIKSTFKHTLLRMYDHIGEPLYHICIINSRPETADNTVYEIHTLFKLPTVMQLTLSSSLSCPLAPNTECPLWSSWIISWILMAPVGPCDLWSYALVMMVLKRREHTLKSDSLNNDLLLLYVHCVL